MSEKKVALIYIFITLIVYIGSKISISHAPLLNNINVYFFIITLFSYGIYFIVVMIQNSQHFRRVYRRIDFIELFGNQGKILYVLIGLLCISTSIAIFCIYHNLI